MGEPHVAPVAGDGDDAAAAAGIHDAFHETFYGILMEWADAQPDAVPWNKWQQEVNKIASKKVPGYRDTFNTAGRNWTKYVNGLWAEIMEVFHGPDWRVKAKEAEKRAYPPPQYPPRMPPAPAAAAADAAGAGGAGAVPAAGAEASAAGIGAAAEGEGPRGPGAGGVDADPAVHAEAPAPKRARGG